MYLYTRLFKSKDIDIVVDYGALRYLSSNYVLVNNERLKKYEIKLEKFDIDLYLPKYSKLALPSQDLLTKFKILRDGFYVPRPEALMALKLGALSDRRDSQKGDKDAIDVLGLLFYSGLELRELGKIFREYKLDYSELLLKTLAEFNPNLLRFLNLNQKSFADLRHEYEKRIRREMEK